MTGHLDGENMATRAGTGKWRAPTETVRSDRSATSPVSASSDGPLLGLRSACAPPPPLRGRAESTLGLCSEKYLTSVSCFFRLD